MLACMALAGSIGWVVAGTRDVVDCEYGDEYEASVCADRYR